jgi:Uma2 family endonuclease
MANIGDISVPITKPATEWVNGRARQKVSPQERHARAQTRIAAALAAWADKAGAGRVGTEWEFRLTPPGEITRPLVPDIAYLSYDRLGYEEDEAAQIPRLAPDVVIEILSPDDRMADVEEKIRVYRASGTLLVVLVDTERQTFTTYDAEGSTVLSRSDTFTHAALPGFAMPVASAFQKAPSSTRRT